MYFSIVLFLYLKSYGLVVDKEILNVETCTSFPSHIPVYNLLC